MAGADSTTSGAAATAPSLPKLPELAPEHLKAISASLPGKLLGRTAALLAALALVLAWYKAVDVFMPEGAKAWRSRWPELFDLLVYGFPVAIVAAQLLREGIASWHARKIRERVIESDIKDPGYFRLVPYTVRDAFRFRRADQAHERALAWIEDAQGSLLYLTGDSGTGKSSLLAAAVIPELEKRSWKVVAARSFADPAGELAKSLRQPNVIWRDAPEEADLSAIVDKAVAQLAKRKEQLCVVLDQFEEFAILHESAQHETFTSFLQHLVAEPLGGLRIILVLRSEYEPLIADLGLPPLRQGDNWFKLGAFTEPAAQGFIAASGLVLDPVQMRRVLRGAAAVETTPGLYRPIVLNVLGVILSRYAGTLPADVVPEQLIQRWLREAIEAPAVRDEASKLLPQMITEAGTKRPRSEEELASATGIPRGRVRHAMLQLADTGIVRPLGRDQVVWEIAHDFMATQIGFLLGRLKRDLWRRALPYATPLLLVLWIASAGSALWLWPEWRYREAIRALNEVGFRVEGQRGGERRITSDNLRAGAFSVLVEHLAAIPNIVFLGINSEDSLASFQGMPELPGLQQLTVSFNPALASLQGMPELPRLQQLTISDNGSLASLRGMPAFPNLQTLEIGSVDGTDVDLISIDRGNGITSLSGIGNLPKLRQLLIAGNHTLQSLNGMPTMPNLLYLNVTENEQLRSLHGMSDLPSLSELFITRNELLSSLQGLSILPNLTSLTIDGNNSIKTLVGLRDMPRLDKLYIESNASLISLDGLPIHSSLTSIDIRENRNLVSLDGLQELSTLRSMRFYGNDKLISLRGMPQLTGLEQLDIVNNKAMDSLRNLPDLPSLEHLKVRSNRIVSLTNLPSLPKLQTLEIIDNGTLISLDHFQSLPALRKVVVRGMNEQQLVVDLASVASLELLIVEDQPSVRAAVSDFRVSRQRLGLADVDVQFIDTGDSFWDYLDYRVI